VEPDRLGGAGHPNLGNDAFAVDPRSPGRSRRLAIITAIFFGIFGVHKFYLGRWRLGILYALFFWTFIPTIVGMAEGIGYFRMSDREWAARYGSLPPTRKWHGRDVFWWSVVVILGVWLAVGMGGCVSAVLTYG
jgi:TM2 domain-containing membrane protein YozV